MPPRIRYERLERKIRLYSTIVSLTGIVGRIAEDARRNASWSSKIPGAISVSSAEQSDAGVKISILVDLEKAPEARAFEYGSGERATKGTAQRYPIRAKNVNFLKFWWEREQKWFVGKQVMHPGVEARPYLQPAIEAHMDELKGALGKAFKEDLLADIPKFEKITA